MKINKAGPKKIKTVKKNPVSIEEKTNPINDAQKASLNLLEDLKSEIEERKIIEEQLREREATLSLILGNINEIVYSTKLTSPNSPHGIIQFISNRCVDILGIPSENFLTKKDLWFNLIHPDDIDSYNQQMAAVFATKKTATLQFRMLNKSTNTYLWLEDLIVPEFDKKGKIIGTFGVARDVTKRKITELLILQKEEDYRKLFEDHSAVKLIIDPENGNIYDANYAAA
jgi:PAS domain S-box-containing protein